MAQLTPEINANIFIQQRSIMIYIYSILLQQGSANKQYIFTMEGGCEKLPWMNCLSSKTLTIMYSEYINIAIGSNDI